MIQLLRHLLRRVRQDQIRNSRLRDEEPIQEGEDLILIAAKRPED